MRRQKANKRSVNYNIRVFINCPFDSRFKPIFDCIVFTVVLCGFRPRCALQIDDGSQTRIEKIFSIIEQCRLGIHDLSRTELDRINRLPRFNMPLELGMFLGVKRSGTSLQRRKSCLVLDRERYRFQKFISDIAGQDIRSHNLEPIRAISAVRDWLGASSGKVLPGGAEIFRQYRRFMKELPALCRKVQVRQSELTFADFLNFSTEWLKRELPVPKVSQAG
jgi:hypothetical protein